MKKKKKVLVSTFFLYAEKNYGLFHHNYHFKHIETIGTKTFYVYIGKDWIKKSYIKQQGYNNET